jgi:hypothetical protein
LSHGGWISDSSTPFCKRCCRFRKHGVDNDRKAGCLEVTARFVQSIPPFYGACRVLLVSSQIWFSCMSNECHQPNSHARNHAFKIAYPLHMYQQVKLQQRESSSLFNKEDPRGPWACIRRMTKCSKNSSHKTRYSNPRRCSRPKVERISDIFLCKMRQSK